VTYLLDTNACIAIINDRPQTVRQRLRKVAPRERVFVSVIAVFELWYGVAKSTRLGANAERLAVFLALPQVLPFDEEDARAAGMIRAALERAGSPISAYDTLIAGEAATTSSWSPPTSRSSSGLPACGGRIGPRPETRGRA
jgi:tRNA(fMet)-specific endonuclease VapC